MSLSLKVCSGIGLGLFALCSLQSAQAQDAKAIFKKMASTYANAKTYQATIEANMVSGQGPMTLKMEVKKSGTKMASRTTGSGAAAAKSMGMNSLIIDDGKMVSMTLPQMRQYVRVPHTAGNNPLLGMSAMMIPSNMVKQLEQDKESVYKLLPPTNFNGKPVYAIEAFNPKNKKVMATLLVDKTSYYIKQIKVSPAPKTDITIVFKNEKVNVPISDKFFVFTPPKGYAEMKNPFGGGGGMGMAPGGNPR